MRQERPSAAFPKPDVPQQSPASPTPSAPFQASASGGVTAARRRPALFGTGSLGGPPRLNLLDDPADLCCNDVPGGEIFDRPRLGDLILAVAPRDLHPQLRAIFRQFSEEPHA